MSQQDYTQRYRLYKLGTFAFNFEGLLKSIGKKDTNLAKLTSMVYFMAYAKKLFIDMQLPDEARTIEIYLKKWNYWSQISVEIDRRKNISTSFSYLMKIEKFVRDSFEDITLDSEDRKIKSIAIVNRSLYYEYVKHLIDLRLRELLYQILGRIWLNIYANKALDISEIRDIVERLRLSDANIPSEEINGGLIVKPEIDKEKEEFQQEIVEQTPLSLRNILKVIMPFVEVFKDNFYKNTELNTKLNNAEIYVFSLLIAARNILPDRPDIKDQLDETYTICKHIHNYFLVKKISMLKGANRSIINELESKYETKLSSLILDLFQKGEELISDINKLVSSQKDADTGDFQRGKRLIYKLTKTTVDPDHLVGLIIRKDDITSIADMVKSGDTVVNVEVNVEPFHIRVDDFSSISLILGQTGSGKSVFSINVVHSALKDGYTVLDCSSNFERAAEMHWCSMPLDEKLHKEPYKFLDKVQKMKPEKLPLIGLYPFYGDKSLPKKLPAGSRVITIPIHTLANKLHAIPILFATKPNDKVLRLVDFVLVNKATKDWDLETLRHELTRLLEISDASEDEEGAKGKKSPEMTVIESVGKLKYEKTYKFDRQVISQALSLLLQRSDLITSGNVGTTIDFDDICSSKAFVVPYLGGLPNKSECLAFAQWLFNSIVDYVQRPENKEKKILVLMNEMQTLVPSQSMVGGITSEKDYASSVDYSKSALQWRGLSLRVLGNTQEQSQIRDQMKNQAGLKIVFRTTNKDDIDFAFSQVQNPAYRETLKIMITNKFFAEEHMMCYMTGPEVENIRIVRSAVPPCSFERPDLDFFKTYEKYFGSDMIDSNLYINMIADDKEKTFEKAAIDDPTIKILERGTKLTEIEADEIKVKKSTIKEFIEKAQQNPEIPEGHSIISDKELAERPIIGDDKTIIDKEKLGLLERTKPVGTDKLVIPSVEYVEVKAIQAERYVDKLEICKELTNEESTLKDFYYDLIHIFVGCESFDFLFSFVGKKSTNEKYKVLANILKEIGYKYNVNEFYKKWRVLREKSNFFKQSFSVRKDGKQKVYNFDTEEYSTFFEALNLDFKSKIYKRCADIFYPKLENSVPWKEEVKLLVQKKSQ